MGQAEKEIKDDAEVESLIDQVDRNYVQRKESQKKQLVGERCSYRIVEFKMLVGKCRGGQHRNGAKAQKRTVLMLKIRKMVKAKGGERW